MKIKSISKGKVTYDDNGNVDYTIYIDTDSIFTSATPLLDHRYLNWRSMDDADIIKIVDDIAGETQDFLNKFYDMLAENIFYIPKGTHRFQIKKEFVSRSGIWVAKKRYAQWIVAENGSPRDKLDVKGLDVVRSSYPAQFRKFMSQVLIDILKGVSEKELTEKIQDFSKSISGKEAVSIAKNSAVKELSKYLPKKPTALFQFKSGTPAHVKAAIAYNELLKHFNCPPKYEPVKDGAKIKWVYLKQNPFGLDGVGFTGYNDPPEIMEFIETYIDSKKLFEREMEGKLEDFYSALGWGDFTVDTTISEQFFQF